jgi:hypothetical protein
MTEKSLLNYKLIDGSLSQAHQESLVINALQFKKNGWFLEIGAADGLEASNTFLLEKEFGWTGLALEWDTDLHSEYNLHRSTECLCEDATLWDARTSLFSRGFPNQVDYLQIDIDPADQSLKALENLPLEEFRFSVITFEHDYYLSDLSLARDASRELLRFHGYHLLVAGVETHGRNFEDWWVDSTLEIMHPLLSRQFENIEASLLFDVN